MQRMLMIERLSAVAVLVAAAVNALADDRPNILLITADDLGLQLSCYGDSIADTPHIDRLADESVRFRTAYVTQASCSPSRSSMFTGLYPHGNGQYGLLNANVGFRVHENLVESLLPNVLKGRGYRTGIDVQSRLERALAEWQERTKDPFRDVQFRQSVEAKYQPKP